MALWQITRPVVSLTVIFHACTDGPDYRIERKKSGSRPI
jgi:hypothetical protein